MNDLDMKKRLVLILLLAFMGSWTYAQSAVAEPQGGHVAEQVRGTDSSSSGFVSQVLSWYDAHMNYQAVGLLMTLESSFVPFPSEVVIPPAVYVACNPENSKVGHLLQLSKEKVQRAEVYFNDHGNVSTLVGRFIPVIRQLISIPAGLSKMNLLPFTFFTFIGAALWNVVLALLGWLAYRAADPQVIERYSHQLSIIIVVLFCAAIAFFVIRAIVRKRREKHV